MVFNVMNICCFGNFPSTVCVHCPTTISGMALLRDTRSATVALLPDGKDVHTMQLRPNNCNYAICITHGMFGMIGYGLHAAKHHAFCVCILATQQPRLQGITAPKKLEVVKYRHKEAPEMHSIRY